RTGERHSHVLIEAGQRRVEAARKPERSRDKKTLSIVDMADNFTDAPFVGCVPTEPLLVGDDLQECKRFRRLTVEASTAVVVSNLVNVAEVVCRCFIPIRSLHAPSNFSRVPDVLGACLLPRGYRLQGATASQRTPRYESVTTHAAAVNAHDTTVSPHWKAL